MNLYGFVKNNPIANFDGLGLDTVDRRFDKTACKLNVRMKWYVEFAQTRGVDVQEAWKRSAKSSIENFFNNAPFVCRSNNRKCCVCADGVTVSLTVDFVPDRTDAIEVSVVDPPLPQSSAGPDYALLDYDDIDSRLTSKRFNITQIPVVHESGHMLGLSHPGPKGSAAPPGSPPGTIWEYDMDIQCLMGRGMILRANDFEKAFCAFISELNDCDPWKAKPKK